MIHLVNYTKSKEKIGLVYPNIINNDAAAWVQLKKGMINVDPKMKNMAWMFDIARSFNQPLNNWNVSKVKEMYGMFHEASSFNQPLNNWNVSMRNILVAAIPRSPSV